MPVHYPYLLDPEMYPDFRRREMAVPTWKTFGNATQFTATRDLSGRNWKEDLDRYTVEFDLGKVVWPLIHLLWSPHVEEVVEEIRKRGLFLFDLWSHVPGSPMDGIWSNITPPAGMVQYLERVLGEKFLGIDNGEQDGRYVWSNGEQQCPSSPDRRRQYLNFQRHFQKMGDELGNRMSALVSLCFGHYFLREGNHMLLGAETAQALPCSQIYYAFIRGAGRQYGIHWFGNASVFNRWGWKDYGPEKHEGRHSSGPEKGTSLNLLQRLIYTHYLYNCVALGFEANWILEKEGPNGTAYELSPIGRIQADAVRFVERNGRPGTMHAPVAVLLDFFDGWAPPRHLYSKNVYQVWGGSPYEPGDYLSHGVLSMLYPGYEDASYYHDERGFLTETPYGDMADCILSDVPSWVLGQFGLVVAAGDLRMTGELAEKLIRCVEGGGRLVITGENARGLLPELGIGTAPVALPPGTAVEWADGSRDVEDHGFELLEAVLPKGAEVAASAGGRPVVVEMKRGKGRITLDLSPYGVVPAGTFAEGPIDNPEDAPLRCPYPLLSHFRRLLDGALSEQRIFTVGEGLGYITCRKEKGIYTVGIHNDTLGPLPFSIESRCGEVKRVRELEIPTDETASVGYWPDGFSGNDGGEDDAKTIAGGAVRLFEVEIAETGVRIVPEPVPANAPGNWFAPLPEGSGIQNAILLCPSFFQNYRGMKVPWTYLHETDRRRIEAEAEWIKRQKAALVVDFSSGLNFYPDLTLIPAFPPHYEESVRMIDDVFDKMMILGATDAVMTLHRKPENHWDAKRTHGELVLRVGELCDRAARRGITIHLQPHPKRWVETVGKAMEFLNEVNRPNLRVALNTGHLVISGEDSAKAVEAAGGKLGAVLFSAPRRDRFGQWYDAHLPFTGEGFDARGFGGLAGREGLLFILDGACEDIDSAYPALKAARGAVGAG